MSVVGDCAYLFGGNEYRRPPGPNNDLYKLDMSGQEFYWSKVEQTGRCPEPRSHHTATAFGSSKILIFGGFRNSSLRYNDVWILDTTTDEWSQPHAGITESKPDGEVVYKRSWPEVPSPRGSHSATLMGSQLYIFGGYGGAGFARRDFNDLSALDLDTWEWRTIECTGKIYPQDALHLTESSLFFTSFSVPIFFQSYSQMLFIMKSLFVIVPGLVISIQIEHENNNHPARNSIRRVARAKIRTSKCRSYGKHLRNRWLEQSRSI